MIPSLACLLGRSGSILARIFFNRMLAFAISMAAILQGHAQADSDQPEDTVTAFYQHIANHECEKAVGLAEGYTIASCRSIEFLKLSPKLERIVWQLDKVAVKAHVEYRRYETPGISSCDVTIPFVRKAKWIIDFRSIKNPRCVEQKSYSKPLAGPMVRDSKSIPLNSSSPAPVIIPPKVKQSLPPPANNLRPTTLLKTWRPDELRGQPGDERIISLRPPDHNPPQYKKPKGKLPKLEGRRLDSIRRVRLPAGKSLVALTFDLCEQADDRTGYDRGIVNFLREQRVPATFFAGGKWMRSHEDKALQLMADPNFEIGNHGWTHGNLRVLKGQKMLDQIVWTQAEYGRLWDVLNRRAKSFSVEHLMQRIPRQPLTLRFPYGTCSAESLHAANELGLIAIQWDVVSGDAASGVSADALARRVVRDARPGSIIVFHANGRGHGTAAVLPRIVDALRARGFSFVTVSNLLREGFPETTNECYELRPGDNRYIDAKFGEGTE